MNSNEVKMWLDNKMPELEFLFENWDGEDKKLSKIQLTTVGIALAQANYKQKVKDVNFDFGIWVK